MDFKKYSFLTDQITFKIEKKGNSKKYYVTGYIATKDRDILNDIITEEGMDSMMAQLRDHTITLDVEHEVYAKKNESIIPVAKIVEAKKDAKGIWVKAELNTHNSRFEELWQSIKGGFVTAFSIMYKPVRAVNRVVDGVKTRFLQSLDLLNVTFTGVPVNPEARISNVMVKSLLEIEEDNTMADEKVEVKHQETEKTVEETEVKSKDREEKQQAENTELKSLIAEVKSLKETIAKLETETKSLWEKLEKPMLKALNTGSIPESDPEEKPEEEPEEQPEFRADPLDMI